MARIVNVACDFRSRIIARLENHHVVFEILIGVAAIHIDDFVVHGVEFIRIVISH